MRKKVGNIGLVLFATVVAALFLTLIVGIAAVPSASVAEAAVPTRVSADATARSVQQYMSGDTFVYDSVNASCSDFVLHSSDKTYCTYTSARFYGNDSSYASKTFDYCYTDVSTGQLALGSVTGDKLYYNEATDSSNPYGSLFYYYKNSSTTYNWGDAVSMNNQGCVYFPSNYFPEDMVLAATFNFSSELCAALQDRMVSVTVAPYIKSVDPTTDTDVKNAIQDATPDAVSMAVFLYNPNDTASPITTAGFSNVSIPIGDKVAVASGAELTVNSSTFKAAGSTDSAFMQVSLQGWNIRGSLSCAISEVGIRVTITPNERLAFSDTSDYTIERTDGERNVDETVSFSEANYASVDSILKFNLVLKSDATNVYLEAETGKVQSGLVFQQLFAVDGTLVKFVCEVGDAEPVEDAPVSDSGLKAWWKVNGGNSDGLLTVSAVISYKNQNTGKSVRMTTMSFTVYVDRDAPPAPAFEKDDFYNKYLSESGSLSYYTGTEDATKLIDAGGNTYAIDIGQTGDPTSFPRFTASSLGLTEETLNKQTVYYREVVASDSTVYYKTYYYGDSMPTVAGDWMTEGFSVAVNDDPLHSTGYVYTAPRAKVASDPKTVLSGSYTGIYCTCKKDALTEDDAAVVEVEYGSLLFSLAYYNETTATVEYRKSGVWMMEFLVYDNVGNSYASTNRAFIQIDITDYTYSVKFVVGKANAESDYVVKASDAVLSYEKINDAGSLTNRGGYINGLNAPVHETDTGSIVLNRGDRVSFKITFNVATYNGYILTGFQIGNGVKTDCTHLSYTSGRSSCLDFSYYELPNGNMSAMYTFEVTSTQCKSEAMRQLNFYFKLRASISVANLTGTTYDGKAKSVVTSVSYNKTMITNVNASTVYYCGVTTDNDDYYAVGERIPLPTDTGATITYRYFVIENYKSTVFPTGTLNNYMIAETTDTVFAADKVYFKRVSENKANYPIHSGTYYCCSSITDNNLYYGQTVTVMTVGQGRPSLSGLVGLKNSSGTNEYSLIYGNSLAVLDYNEGTRDSRIQTMYRYRTETVDWEGQSCRVSTDGIIGYYIFEIDRDSTEYTRPSAGLHECKVTFVPVKGSVKYENSSFSVVYEESDGALIQNNDYATVNATVLVRVRHSSMASFSLSGTQKVGTDEGTVNGDTVEFTYTGGLLTVAYSVVSTYENRALGLIATEGGLPLDLTGNTEVGYAQITEKNPDLDLTALRYTTSQPMNAGLYVVRVALVESTCNYTGSVYWYLQINRIDLNVSVLSSIFTYQNDELPSVTATTSYGTAPAVDLQYTYYYYSGNGALNDACLEKNLVEKDYLRNYVGTPYLAGTYVVKVEVVDNDYAGVGYGSYVIQKVADGNNGLQKNWPAINSGLLSQDYNIMFGQPASEVRIAGGSTYNVKYDFRTYSSANKSTVSTSIVPGEFFIAYQTFDAWRTAEKKTDTEITRAEYVTRMKNYDTASASSDPYSWYLVFYANDVKNFDFLYTTASIKIGPASLNWDKVVADPITYEGTVTQINAAGKANNATVSKTVGYVYSLNGTEPLGKVKGTDYYVIDGTVYCYVRSDLYTYALGSDTQGLFDAAGDIYLPINFIPSNTENYPQESYNCPMTIEKKNLTVTFTGGDGYSVSYNNYEETDLYGYFTYTGATMTLPVLRGNFAYEKDGDEVSVTAEEKHALLSGTYSVTYTVNHNNYSGTVTFPLTVCRATLAVAVKPSVSNESTAQCYNQPVTGLRYYNGQMISAANSGETVQGTFAVSSVHDGILFGNAGTKMRVFFVFTPKSSEYETFVGDGANDGYLDLTVNKIDVSDSMTLAVGAYTYKRGHGEYGALTRECFASGYSSDGKDVGLRTYSDYLKAKLEYQAVLPDFLGDSYELSVSGTPVGDYVPAGKYTVTMAIPSVDDVSHPAYNYTGSVTAELEVERDKVYIELSDEEGVQTDNILRYTFDGTTQKATATVRTLLGDSAVTDVAVSQTYYQNGYSLTSPGSIGAYEVRLRLINNANYTLVMRDTGTAIEFLSGIMYIGINPAEVVLTNLDQTYSQRKAVILDLGANDAVCEIEYILYADGAEVGKRFTDGAFPTDAGRYRVYLVFGATENNGYEEDYLWEQYLEIGKYTANILVAESATCTYVGESNTQSVLTAYTEPYGLSLLYSYRTYGDKTAEYTSTTAAGLGRLSVGKYDVKVSVSHSNYCGEASVMLTVKPAPLTVSDEPVFGEYVYNADKDSLPTVTKQGTVFCYSDGNNVEGTFSVAWADICALAVGQRNVTYTFSPNSSNYASVTGTTALTVVKATYDIEKHVSLSMNGKSNLLEESAYAVEYNAQRYAFDALFDTDAVYNIATLNTDFSVLIRYNGSDNGPIGLGLYTVTATVVSKNYTGSYTWPNRFEVTKGVPIIKTKPTVVASYALKSGYDTVKEDDVIGGKAVIGSTGAAVHGVFSAVPRTFTAANKNEISVLFTPNDTELFSTVTFTLSVDVVGQDVFKMYTGTEWEEKSVGDTVNGEDWTGTPIDGYAVSKKLYPDFTTGGVTPLEAGTHVHGAYIAISPKKGTSYLTYGASLSDFVLTFASEECEGCRKCAECFNTYGVLKFTDATLVPDVGDSVQVEYSLYQNGAVDNQERLNTMRGYINLGNVLKKVVISSAAQIELVGFVGSTLAEEYRLTVTDKGTKLDFEPDSVTFDYAAAITRADNDKLIAFTSFSAKNYEFATTPIARLTVNILMQEEDIYIGNASKKYDGKPISVADLNPNVHNTTVAVEQSAYLLTVKNALGETVDGIAVGVYTVEIRLRDTESGYFGDKEVTFEVQRMDVSKLLTLNKTSDVFGSETCSVNPTVFYKGAELSRSEYTVRYRLTGTSDVFRSTISVAGTYDLKVTVDGENYYGSTVLSYTVQPRTVRVIPEAYTYSFMYGEERKENRTINLSFIYADSGETGTAEALIYYSSATYSKRTEQPTGVGTYRVTVEPADSNLAFECGTLTFIIRPKSVIIDTLPTLNSVKKGTEVYNIKYGQTLKEVVFVPGTGRASSDNEEIEGTFSVAASEANLIPEVGTVTATVCFTPTNGNYATATATCEVTVGKAEATVTFTKLSADYNGMSKLDGITYAVSPKIDISLRFTSLSDNTTTTNPIRAGSYRISVTTTNTNYSIVLANTSGDTPVFVIGKAKVNTDRTVTPDAGSVSVGESLTKSSLTSGAVYYVGFNNPVEGVFEYVQTALVFRNAGNFSVEYRFVPDDSANFATYEGTVPLTVKKGKAMIAVSNTGSVYGTGADFSLLTFTTNPTGLKVSFDPTYNGVTYKNGDIMEANTYYFTCEVVDDNYESGKVEFKYIVEKKNIEMDILDTDGVIRTSFNVSYSKSLLFRAYTLYAQYRTADATYFYHMYDSSSPERDGYLDRDVTTIYNLVEFRYVNKDSSTEKYDSSSAPTALGSYTMTITLRHDNYTAVATATYKVVKGTVEKITFDEAGLNTQIYGSVSAPVVSTTPTGVSYYIIYQGYDKVMPTTVNSYNITVYVDDPNYTSTQISAVFTINPKPITIKEITVADKRYDGTNVLEATGTLNDILYNDEVRLTLTARTADLGAEAGVHKVEITSYALTGLKAENYTLVKGNLDLEVTIYGNKITDENSTSYLLSASGFAEGTAVSFYTVDRTENKTNAFTTSVGVESAVVGYTVTVNGESTIVSDQYMVCIEIPENFIGKEFDVEGAGDLKGQDISFSRQGNYITFYASTSSGEVVFSRAEMQYTTVVLIVAAAIFIIGIIGAVLMSPTVRSSMLRGRGGNNFNHGDE